MKNASLLNTTSFLIGILSFVLLPTVVSAEPQSENPASHKRVDVDLLLVGGTIYDGSGSPGKIGDVALRGERIVALGQFEVGRVGRVVDCKGLVVAPGFIDLHTHSDRSVLRPGLRNSMNYLTQGCTTCVTGNCGLGPKSTTAYLDQVDRDGAGTNIIHLIPHGPLRSMGMGNAKRPANAKEIERMRTMIGKAMRAGAWGMSTGLEYNWSCYADINELVALSKEVAAHGGIYTTHIRNQSEGLIDAIAEAIEIGRLANIPVHVSHIKGKGLSHWGKVRKAIALMEEARRRGQKVTADNYPYTISCTGLSATLLPEASIPGGRANLFKRMEADPSFAETVRQAIKRQLDESEKIVIASCKNKQWIRKSLSDIANDLKVDRVEVALKLLRMGGGTGLRFAMCEDDIRYTMKVPWVAIASDGWGWPAGENVTCHPRNFGTFPRVIGRYAMREKILPVEQAIRSATGLPADILGLKDRGYLREGAYADIVVFDPKTFIDRATIEKPAVYSSGVRYVLISGNMALEDGKINKNLYGRSIRHRSLKR
ncbi:MAG: D-aminoacylase [Pirellulales bacterium]|nr:D-aminoacylase [Pirellulales bacterium]